MTRAIDALEDELQEPTRNREVLEWPKFPKSLTSFTTAPRSNELMMERLQRSRWFAAYPEDGDLLEDVIRETRQAIDRPTSRRTSSATRWMPSRRSSRATSTGS